MSNYIKWSINNDAPLYLEVAGDDGSGVTTATPLVAVKRVKEVGGAALDGYYLSGSCSFVSTPTFLSMSGVDATNFPGLYTYTFSQSLIQKEYMYSVYYKNSASPIGFATETHYFVVSSSTGDISLYESEEDT